MASIGRNLAMSLLSSRCASAATHHQSSVWRSSFCSVVGNFSKVDICETGCTGGLNACGDFEESVGRKMGTPGKPIGGVMSASPMSLIPRVVIYDGVCHLCNAGVRWVIKADKHRQISFCALQSRMAEPYLLACGLTHQDVLNRFVFVEGPGLYSQASTAALRVALHLPLPYSALSVFLIIPASVRDALYDYVAKRRYQWFGKSEECIVPSYSILDRFIDKEELVEKGRQSQEEE